MRSALLVLSVAVSVVLARPSISSSHASASASHASPRPSVMNDLKAAGRISQPKLVLPDGVFPDMRQYVDDIRLLKKRNNNIQVVPMMEMDEADYPLPSLVHKPLYKHQKTTDGKPAYKHLGLAQSEEAFDPVKITLLPPGDQSEMNKQHEAMKGNFVCVQIKYKGKKY
jgi:hypothetical protein